MREVVPHIDLILNVHLTKLFSERVPSSPANNATTRVALHLGNENGCEGVKAVHVRSFTSQEWLFIVIIYQIFSLARDCSKQVK